MTRPLGVILAGGLSRRMGGGDKALLILAGRPLISHVIKRLGPQVSALAINANGDPARFGEFGLPVIADSIEGFAGPLAGVLAGLDWAAEQNANYIVTAAADTPFFPPDLVKRLQAGRGNNPIALAATPDPERGLARHPTFGLWPVTLRENLREALADGVRKVVAWSDVMGCSNVLFAPDQCDPFFNVNTAQDMKLAEEINAKGIL